MKMTTYYFDNLLVSLCEFENGESVPFEKDIGNKSFGFYSLSGTGTSTYTDASGIPQTSIFENVKKFVRHEIIDFDHITTASNNLAYVCVSKNHEADPDRSCTPMSVKGLTEIPANHAFVVLEGNVIINGEKMSVCDFCRPRDSDFTVNGDAEIVLIQ